MRSQARHSGLTSRTVFGADRQAVMRHSSEVIMPSVTACRTAVLTVERETAGEDRDVAQRQAAETPACDLGWVRDTCKK